MNHIQQSYAINAPIQKVWHALTDAETAEQWGAAPAKVDPREGGAFSYWGGDIHGIYTKLIPYERIEQDWYGYDHPERKFRAVFTFMSHGEETVIRLVFSGEIEDAQKDIKDWQDYYFTPIKELLEAANDV